MHPNRSKAQKDRVFTRKLKLKWNKAGFLWEYLCILPNFETIDNEYMLIYY